MKILIKLKKETSFSQEEREVLINKIEELLVYYRIYNFKNEGIIFFSDWSREGIGISLENCSLRHAEYAKIFMEAVAKIVGDFFGQKVDYIVHFKPAPEIRGTFFP